MMNPLIPASPDTDTSPVLRPRRRPRVLVDAKPPCVDSRGRGCARPASEGSLDESPSRPDGMTFVPFWILMGLVIVFGSRMADAQSSAYPQGVTVTSLQPPSVMITPIASGWSPSFATVPLAPVPGLGASTARAQPDRLTALDPLLGPVATIEPIAPLSAKGLYTLKTRARLAAVAQRTRTSLSDLVALNPKISPNDFLPAGTRVLLPKSGP